MEYGCCLPIQAYELAARTGYDVFGLSASEIAGMEDAQFDQALATVQSGRMKCADMNIFAPPTVRLCGPGWSVEGVDAYLQRLLPRASALGIKQIGVGSPKSRHLPDGFDRATGCSQLVRSFELICDQALTYGIGIMAEAVCDLECNHINTTRDALALLERVNRPNLSLVYDIYHAEQMHEPTEWIAEAARYITLVHIAQLLEDGQRGYLREANLPDYRRSIDALRNVGYDGCISLEAFCGDLEVELPRSLELLRRI